MSRLVLIVVGNKYIHKSLRRGIKTERTSRKVTERNKV